MFDGLTSEQQLKMIQKALTSGENSGDAGILDMKEIRKEAKRKVGLNP